ncbi:MAG: hypothetical protein WBO10_12690 [Pyrinomonadaceae bacterium]
MKVRLRSNSIRLRLTQNDLDRFIQTGEIEETIAFGPGPGEQFVYRLANTTDQQMHAVFDDCRITVFVPYKIGGDWTESGQVGAEAEQKIGGGKILRILVEKDFACLKPRHGDEDKDTFPHPLMMTPLPSVGSAHV